MKLICTQDNFKKAIYNSERVVAKQNTLPILNNILLEAEKGFLKLSATNLEIGVVVKISAKTEKEGKITIPARFLSNFSTNLPFNDSVLLEISEQNLKIKSGAVKAVIKGLPASDFPLIPKKNTEFLLNISSIELKNILSKVMVATALNEARAELTGVNLILEKDELFFASTDSFRLVEHKLMIDKKNCNTLIYNLFIEKKNNIIIPAATLIELNRIISADTEGEVRMAIEDGQIFFETNGTILVSRLINGKYPEYKHIMPKKYNTRVVGDKKTIQSAVKMASVFAAGKGSEISLKIDSEAKKVFIGAKSVEVGENSTELNFDVSGPSQEIIVNSKYLLDGINTVSTSQVAILLNSESTPVAICEINEKTGEVLGDFVYIVMPIKA
ncbi:MAG TPA: DNA polymerase III subunit beta [Candidatus Moranbacteria bacterium]|nr:DNA polymerase III subunit beta [Candidatus Moranbacteria bacterium]